MAATSENDCRFRGKSIVITGAGGSFGREGCLYFASRGAIVAGLDKNKEALEETASYVKSQLGSSNANRRAKGGGRRLLGSSCSSFMSIRWRVKIRGASTYLRTRKLQLFSLNFKIVLF